MGSSKLAAWALLLLFSSFSCSKALEIPRTAAAALAAEPWSVVASAKPQNSAPNSSRRLVEGLECDLQLYAAFLASDEGQDTFVMATMCESRIAYLRTSRAGAFGPVEQTDLRSAMCSAECLKSDELHQRAMAASRCSCAELSAPTFVVSDFCLDNSARLLCSLLGECGHWGCALDDFMCQRYEWDRYYACAAPSLLLSSGFVVVLVATTMLLL